MKKDAIFPGSFDPFTKGHEDIVKRASPLFDNFYIAIGVNSNKKPLFSLEQRINWISQYFKEYHNIKIISYSGLTIELCNKLNCNFLVRGIRNCEDFRYETDIAIINNSLNNKIETVFFYTNPKFSHINSSFFREIYLNNGNYKIFLPDSITFDDSEK